MKRVKNRQSTVASHQLRRLHLIQTLQRGFITASDDELEAELTMGNLLASCDAEAAAHDDIVPYDRLRNDAALVLENAGIRVDRYRFLIPHKSKQVLGTTLFLSEIATDRGEGEAVMHLITNPSNPQFAYVQMNTRYRVPSLENATAVTARTLVPTIQGYLRQLGHKATAFRHSKMAALGAYIEKDETVGKSHRFIDLSSEATILVAHQIRDRLAGEYDEVNVVNRHGRYCIAASKR